MAFNNSVQRADTFPDGRQKASGFINIWLPSSNGDEAKLGAIPIVVNNKRMERFHEWIQKDPEAAMERLLRSMVLKYNSATPKGGDFAVIDED